jgi:hypothetical protein
MQHRDVAPSQSERGSRVGRLPYVAIKFAECMGLAAAPRQASEMAIIGTVPTRRKPLKCNASSKEYADRKLEQ